MLNTQVNNVNLHINKKNVVVCISYYLALGCRLIILSLLLQYVAVMVRLTETQCLEDVLNFYRVFPLLVFYGYPMHAPIMSLSCLLEHWLIFCVINPAQYSRARETTASLPAPARAFWDGSPKTITHPLSRAKTTGVSSMHIQQVLCSVRRV